MSVPNGGERSYVTASLSKSTGEYTGASDLIVVHYGKVLFVEVKTPTGKQSKAQQEFEKHITSCGLPYYIVRSVEEFKNVIAGL